MESLKTRLDPQKEAVLDFTRTFGRFKAMKEFGVRGYVNFHDWLEEVTGDEKFGLNPKISLDGHQSLGDQLVAAFLRKVAELQAENEALLKRIEFLEFQLNHKGEKEELQALAIMELCQA